MVTWHLLFVSLVVFLVCLPFMHSIFGLSDEGVKLRGAELLLRGQRLYKDFFEFVPPGSFVIMAVWFWITGISIWSARLLAVLTITGIACFTYLACRQASKREFSSAFVAIGWAVMSPGIWTQINHHWFTTLFSMLAAWVSLASVEKPAQSRQWEPLIAGIAAGAAAMVLPNCGGLLMLAAATCFVGSGQKAKLIAYALGSAIIPICLLVYIIAQGALAAAFDDVMLFTVTRYASIQSVPFGSVAYNQSLPLLFLFPFVAILTLITCARDWRAAIHDRLFLACVAFALAGFIGCFPRPDMIHIAFVAPLACPLLTYCIQQIFASSLSKTRYALAAVLIVFVIEPVAAFASLAAQIVRHEKLVATPRGRVAFWKDGTAELMERIAATPSLDRYFFYPYIPMLAFLSGRDHVSKHDVFVPGFTSPSQYKEACLSAMQRASWLVIDRQWLDPTFLKRLFPKMQQTEPREKMMFELALQSGFELVARYGSFELHRRVKAVDETVCTPIPGNT
jgi:hypothetical protein